MWLTPTEILNDPNVTLFPPQVYELNRLSHVKDITELIHFAKERSAHSDEFFYTYHWKVKDGAVVLMPGDELCPKNIDYNKDNRTYSDKTILELREKCQVLHRLEIYESPKRYQFVIKITNQVIISTWVTKLWKHI